MVDNFKINQRKFLSIQVNFILFLILVDHILQLQIKDIPPHNIITKNNKI